ncbi:hypothetical protein [Caldilinea sp.]|uniref:hypothetical protein n=1 Tax=Caldilinea sp. TaxID=2293560 RepID=UPI0021DF14E1|nr:hypothetical protein [Caldilinea sp.]GIV70628.1 MAG: hypothetical protein KatS3mg048_3490 [Caldilinea sp.]
MHLDGRQAQTSSMRIDWRRLIRYILLLLVAPTLAAIALDQILAISPWLTLIVSLICIPATTVVVMRTALLEFEKIIEVVAPVEPEADVEPELAEASAVTGAEQN